MANITPGEARLGYGLYLASNGDIGADELQGELDQLGVGTLSPRMFRHYRALFGAGYDHYIPINRFDILQATEPYSNESANSRYRYAELGAAVRVTVIRDEPFTFLATAVRISDAGVTLEVQDEKVGPQIARGRRSLRSGDYLRIDFFESDRPSIDGRLIDKPEQQPGESRWLLDVEFNRLRSVVEFTEGQAVAAEPLPVRLVADDGGPVPADVLGRRLFYFLDAVENARALFNQVAASDESYPDRAYPARISRVQMDSPLEIVLIVPMGLLGILSVAWGVAKGLPIAFRTVQEGRLAGARARRERAEAESVELSNEERRAAIAERTRLEVSRTGGQVSATAAQSRRFDQTVTQLLENVDGLEHSQVLSLDLPEGVDDVGLLDDPDASRPRVKRDRTPPVLSDTARQPLQLDPPKGAGPSEAPEK